MKNIQILIEIENYDFSEEEIFLLACDRNWNKNQTYIKIKLLREIFSNFKKIGIEILL